MKDKNLASMKSPEPTDTSRRLLLRVIAKLMLAFAVLVALWVILSPLFKPNVPVNAKAVETVIDVSEFSQDSVEIIEWFDKPLIVARRSVDVEAGLKAADIAGLRDPGSEKSVQPLYASQALRSGAAGWFVAIGIGTSSGCALTYSSSTLQKSEPVIFTDGCDGSRYDLAGRALAGSIARKNLPVPHWRLSEDRIVVSTEPVRK